MSRDPGSVQAYDRVIVSVALGNTDDHLRNHGFFSDRGSWTLSPVFDPNPNPNPDPDKIRATSIMGADALPEGIDGLLASAEDCSLTVNQARERMSRIFGRLAESGAEQPNRGARDFHVC